MDISQLNQITSDAWELCTEEKWHAAIIKYEQVMCFLDSAHPRAQFIYGEYAMALENAERPEDAEGPLRSALHSAVLSDGEESAGAAVARYFLAYNLAQRNKIKNAYEVVADWFDRKTESQWLMNFMGALLAAKEGNNDLMKMRADDVFHYAPSGKWSDPEDVEKSVFYELDN